MGADFRPPLFAATPFDLVVIAGSAGGMPALKQILSQLPPSFPTAIAVVQHLAPLYPSMLAELLGMRAAVPVAFARDGDRLRAGKVLIAPPDRHLVVTANRRVSLSQAAKVHHTRPAADLLFESAAMALGGRVVAVVLSGMGRDGAAGARAIKNSGGSVLVQAPHTADAPSMPEAAIATDAADLVLPLESMTNALIAFTMVRGAPALLGRPLAAAR